MWKSIDGILKLFKRVKIIMPRSCCDVHCNYEYLFRGESGEIFWVHEEKHIRCINIFEPSTGNIETFRLENKSLSQSVSLFPQYLSLNKDIKLFFNVSSRGIFFHNLKTDKEVLNINTMSVGYDKFLRWTLSSDQKTTHLLVSLCLYDNNGLESFWVKEEIKLEDLDKE